MGDSSRPVVHEDDDMLVRCVRRVCDPSVVVRKPGYIAFTMDFGAGRELRVTRSRFMGVYGNICQMEGREPGHEAVVTYAPTEAVVGAMVVVDGYKEKLLTLFQEWVKEGNRR